MNETLKSSQEEYKNKLKFNEELTKAKASFINKNYSMASNYLKEALSIYPENLDARELAADILLINGKVKEAGNEYKSIYDADNTRVKCEEKYAKCVLQVFNSDEKIRQMEAELLGENPIGENDKKYMIFLCCLIPGLGRIIKENYLIGVIIFIVYLLFIGLAVNSTDFRSGILNMFFKPTALLADFIWICSLVDTINLFMVNKRK